jgi:hypothetical protein
MDFYVALQIAMRARNDARLIHCEEMIATLPDRSLASINL